MENFIAYNPTKVHFGKGVVGTLGREASGLGKKALLVYGRGSVLKNGSYRDTVEQLKNSGISIVEFSGIKPNPGAEDVDRAAELGIREGVDFVVGLGGGSAIDSAKLIAVCTSERVDCWSVHTKQHAVKSALPLLAVLTLSATGTEMNAVGVVQNNSSLEKFGFAHPLMYPRHSYLDPVYTRTVPPEQTANGIADLAAHALEAYFGQGEASLSDRFVESILLEAMEFGPALMQDLDNYELRARMMWAATNALNGLTSAGRRNGSWTSHAIGHQLSLLFDTAHGASLTIAFPAWMKHMAPRIGRRLEKLGERIFGNASAEDAIAGFEGFFRDLGCPVRLDDIGVTKDSREEILELMNRNDCKGKDPELYLDDRDRAAILELMFA